MKKEYTAPEIQIVEFAAYDIILQHDGDIPIVGEADEDEVKENECKA